MMTLGADLGDVDADNGRGVRLTTRAGDAGADVDSGKFHQLSGRVTSRLRGPYCCVEDGARP